MADFSCESADDVIYIDINDVKYKKNKKLISCVHERIANCMELECRDRPEEDRCETVK